MTTTVNDFGNIQMVDTRGYPTPAFRASWRSLVERTGGNETDVDFTNITDANAAITALEGRVTALEAEQFLPVAMPAVMGRGLEPV